MVRLLSWSWWNTEYSFITITPSSFLTQVDFVSVLFMGQMALLNHLLIIIIIINLKPYSCVQVACIKFLPR